MKRIKVITSHAGHWRFLAECGAKSLWLARKHLPVKTPYSSGPSVLVLEHKGRFVTVAESQHKRYEVWSIPAHLVRQTDDEAMAEQLDARRCPAS